MKKYIFLSAEGSTFQPNSTSLEPDIDNLQVIGFGEGNTSREALTKLVKENPYLLTTDFDDISALRLFDDSREYLSLKQSIT